MSAILFLFCLPHTSVCLYVTTFLCVIFVCLPFLVLFFLRIWVIVSAMSIQHEGPHVAFIVMQIFWQQTLFLNKSWSIFFFLHFEELFLVIEFLLIMPSLPTVSTRDIPLLLAFTVPRRRQLFIMLVFSVYDELFCLLATFKFFSLFFEQFEYCVLRCGFFVFILFWVLLNTLEMEITCFAFYQIWEVLGHYFWNIFATPYCSPITHKLVNLMLFYRFLRPCSFFFDLFSVWS